MFLDDFCGSGSQAVKYSRTFLTLLREIEARSGQPLEISYLVLAARDSGLATVRTHTDFDSAEAVLELDESYRSLTAGSRHFKTPFAGVTQAFARQTTETHGGRLAPGYPLGFADSQLLLGFHHNTPDNTLRIIWWDEPNANWAGRSGWRHVPPSVRDFTVAASSQVPLARGHQ